MSRSVRGPDYSKPKAKEPKVCEADERNRRALFILENEWGCGKIDVPAMQRLLRGEPDNCDNEGGHDVQDIRTATP